MSDTDYTMVTLEIDCTVREARQLDAALDAMSARISGPHLGDVLAAITAIALWSDNPDRDGQDATKALRDAIPPGAWDQWLTMEMWHFMAAAPAAVAGAPSGDTDDDVARAAIQGLIGGDPEPLSEYFGTPVQIVETRRDQRPRVGPHTRWVPPRPTVAGGGSGRRFTPLRCAK